MKITAHVSVAEFIASDSATRYGISNAMNSTELACATLLCEKVFEPLRTHANKPIKINSGFRSMAVNKRVGGASSSQHCKGEAMDLAIDSKAFHYIRENLVFDQLICEFPVKGEPSWVHVSYSSKRNRGQVLIAVKIAKKTVYLPYIGNENLVN